MIPKIYIVDRKEKYICICTKEMYVLVQQIFYTKIKANHKVIHLIKEVKTNGLPVGQWAGCLD